jgi:hypothetical protein
LIGNTIIEAYVISEKLISVEETLGSRQLEFSFNLDLLSDPSHGKSTSDVSRRIVRRVGSLYRRAKLVNLKSTILEVFSEGLIQQIKNYANDPKAISALKTPLTLVKPQIT